MVAMVTREAVISSSRLDTLLSQIFIQDTSSTTYNPYQSVFNTKHGWFYFCW